MDIHSFPALVVKNYYFSIVCMCVRACVCACIHGGSTILDILYQRERQLVVVISSLLGPSLLVPECWEFTGNPNFSLYGSPTIAITVVNDYLQ